MKFNSKNNGFTLVEIVFVIGIMAVFSAVIYSSFDPSRAKSRDQKRVSDISRIQLALEQYFQKNGIYPQKLDILKDVDPSSHKSYILSIPTDPVTNEPYSTYFPISKTSAGSPDCVSYQLWTTFELNNVYLESKKSFNSSSLPSNMYQCGSGHVTVDASNSVNPLVYDVMP